jgi:small conductance mechanosensitive channel
MNGLLGAGVNGKVTEFLHQGIGLAMAYVPRLALAVIVLVVGWWLIKRVVTVASKRLHAKDPTLATFLSGLISLGLKILLLISVASMVGIETTSFIAVIGAAGLAVGLALQGSLANFAGGALILFFKPFKIGDVIEAQGYLGKVDKIQILYTTIDTFDNRRIIVPNGKLSNESLTNISAYDTRRCDMTFGIGYGDDIDKAKAVCKRLIESDERALAEPAPLIVVGALGASSVDLTVRVWTQSGDLWPFFWDMQEKVKKAFDAEGISIPFPQRDVHVFQAR